MPFLDSPRALSFLALTLSLGACTYRTPPVHVPQTVMVTDARLEVGTLEVLEHGASADAETVDAMRTLADDLLARASSTDANASPVRVDLHVWLVARSGIRDAMHVDGFAGMAYLGAPLGLVTDNETLVVEVVLHRGSDSIVGFGIGERMGGMYASARRRALADALDHAFASAAANVSSP